MGSVAAIPAVTEAKSDAPADIHTIPQIYCSTCGDMLMYLRMRTPVTHREVYCCRCHRTWRVTLRNTFEAVEIPTPEDIR